MSLFTEILNTLKTTLENFSGLINTNFVINYAPATVQNPLTKACVAIGLEDINISQGSFSSYVGVLNDTEIFSNLVDVKISMNIYMPQSFGGSACYDLFSLIYECLLEKRSDLGVQNISCGKLKYDQEAFWFNMPCQVNLSLFAGEGQEEQNISSIIVKSKGEV